MCRAIVEIVCWTQIQEEQSNQKPMCADLNYFERDYLCSIAARIEWCEQSVDSGRACIDLIEILDEISCLGRFLIQSWIYVWMFFINEIRISFGIRLCMYVRTLKFRYCMCYTAGWFRHLSPLVLRTSLLALIWCLILNYPQSRCILVIGVYSRQSDVCLRLHDVHHMLI